MRPVLLIHFPIAPYICAVVFRLIDWTTNRRRSADATYCNISVAAISTFPVLVTGILAWHFQLETQPIQRVLLLHLVLACVSSVMIWAGIATEPATVKSISSAISRGQGMTNRDWIA